MIKRIMFGVMPTLAALLILIGTVGISKVPVGFAQDRRKTISGEALSRPETEPVIIADLRRGAKNIDLNSEFDGEEEWLKDVSFKAKNHSTRTVTYVGLEMFFSDSHSSDVPMVRQLRFGQWPDHPNPANPAISLKPGESIDISIPSQYESLKRFIQMKRSMSSINKMMIRVYLVFFDDGSKWDSGNFYVPDSNGQFVFRKVDPPPGIIRSN